MRRTAKKAGLWPALGVGRTLKIKNDERHQFMCVSRKIRVVALPYRSL
jgi:hypothetical protein